MDNPNLRRTLIDDKLRKPRGIVVHPTLGRVIWTDWDSKRPKIEYANLDGGDRQILVDNFIGMPNSLSLDYENYQVCWTDGGSVEMNIDPKIGIKNSIYF